MSFLKPLLQSDIERAMKYTKSNSSAARYLSVARCTYKKYASQYYDESGVSLYAKHLNRGNKGGPRLNLNNHSKKFPLEDVLAGKFPEYPLQKLKYRLFSAGVLLQVCEVCGYDEPRITDKKVPLLLSFKTEDSTNFSLENLELLCYNCYHNLVGNIVGAKKEETLPNI